MDKKVIHRFTETENQRVLKRYHYLIKYWKEEIGLSAQDILRNINALGKESNVDSINYYCNKYKIKRFSLSEELRSHIPYIKQLIIEHRKITWLEIQKELKKKFGRTYQISFLKAIMSRNGISLRSMNILPDLKEGDS